MSPKPGSQPLVYDENLLSQAPEVTQGQRQEGYDADILNPSPPPASRTPAPNQPYRDHPDVESGSSAHDKQATGGYDHYGQPAKKPFWKTPKGMIILAVLGLAVIAAVVGGAVGGTVGKNKGDKGQNASDGAAPATGSTAVSSVTTPTTTATGQTPGETGGGDTPGGGGSNQTTSRREGTSPTQATSAVQSTSTVASFTTPAVDPPGQPGSGDGAGTS